MSLQSDTTGYVDANMLARAAGIDPTNLQREFADLPGAMAYWVQQYANAAQQYLTMKAAFEVCEARLATTARVTFEVQGKKATEATITEAVRTTDEWLKARTALIQAEGDKIRIHGIVSTVEAKREMLVSLGAHIRMEMNAFPSVATAAAARQGQAHQQGVGSVTDWVDNIRNQSR